MPWCFFNHPILFAAVAVVAIGVVIYEIVSGQEEGRQRIPHRRPPSPPPRPPSPPRYLRPRTPSPPDSPRHLPRPPSPPDSPRHLQRPPSPPDSSRHVPHNSNESFQNSSDTNLRRRNRGQTSPKDRSLPDSENSVRITSLTADKGLNETSSTADSQNIHPKKFDENNYCKNVLNKLTNDTKNVNENFSNKRILKNNIYEEDSDSSENNLLPKNEGKVVNKSLSDENVQKSKKLYKCKRKSKNAMEKSTENHIDSKLNNYSHNSNQNQTKSNFDSQSDDSECSPTKAKRTHPLRYKNIYPNLDLHASKNATKQTSKSESSDMHPEISVNPLANLGSDLVGSSSSSDWNTFESSNSSSDQDTYKSSSLSSDQDTYKSSSSSSDEAIYKKEMYEALKNDVHISKKNNPGCTSICSSGNIKDKESSKSNFCRGCEEKRINTRAYPCQHSYLCVDCAVRVFRLYKKCSICLKDVEEFLQFAL